MGIALLFNVAIVVIHCCKAESGSETNDFFFGNQNGQKNGSSEMGTLKSKSHLRVFLAEHNFPGITKTLISGSKLPNERQNGLTLMLKDTAARSRDYGSNLDKSISKINNEQGIGQALFQSDIVLTDRQAEKIFEDLISGIRTKRQVLKDKDNPNTTWNDGVFYTFNTSDHSVKKAFRIGMRIWSDLTCIDFVEDKNAIDKVVVVKEPGCWSSIGRLGGDQFLSLGEGCARVGSAVHEIGHVLGLFHTMARYDRDHYIRIVVENLDPSCVLEFTKVDKNYAVNYGLNYDYGSIMHYDELSGTDNGQPTMIAADAYYQKTMGSQVISFSDIFMINEHYGCNAKCKKSTSARCANKGFPHPRNCSICICPSGYGGALCAERPPGCGEDLAAARDEQTVMYRIGFGTSLRDQFSFCNYMIMVKIEVNVHSISHGYDEGGCPRGGVEIKAQKDQKLTGYRFCSMNGSGGPIVSYYNRVPVILFNRLGIMQTMFTYRYID